MSVIPEIILHNVLVNGLREIRKDSRILDTMFKNLDQVTLQAFKDSILKQSINFTLNYPRAGELKTPTIALVLKSERESETFLGDLMGAPPHYGVPDQEHVIDTLGGHGGSISGLQGLSELLVAGLEVDTVEVSPEQEITQVIWVESDRDKVVSMLDKYYQPPCMKLIVSTGTGAGQTFQVLSVTPESATIKGVFEPMIDSSSRLDLRLFKDPELRIGEPSRVYPACSNVYRLGANYTVQYQLSVITGNQDETIYLYTVLKGLLYSQKMFMESQGIQNLEISGSDLAPRTEFLPNEVFHRVMTLSFRYSFSFLQEQESYSQLQLNVTPRDVNTGSACGDIISLVDFKAETTI